jgi:hypothetical protein
MLFATSQAWPGQESPGQESPVPVQAWLEPELLEPGQASRVLVEPGQVLPAGQSVSRARGLRR